MTFLGEFFFFLQSAEFFKKKSKKEKIPLVPNTMMQRTTNENVLVPLCCIHCGRFNILSSFSPETKRKLLVAKKQLIYKYRGMFTTSLKSKSKNSGTLEGKKIHLEKSLTAVGQSCTKPFNKSICC